MKPIWQYTHMGLYVVLNMVPYGKICKSIWDYCNLGLACPTYDVPLGVYHPCLTIAQPICLKLCLVITMNSYKVHKSTAQLKECWSYPGHWHQLYLTIHTSYTVQHWCLKGQKVSFTYVPGFEPEKQQQMDGRSIVSELCMHVSRLFL